MFLEPYIQGNHANTGWIEVITGPMFSGKTEELLRRLKRAEIAQQKVKLFKPTADNRFHNEKVVSHNKNEKLSDVVTSAKEILRQSANTQVVCVDEIQFFDDDIVKVCSDLADSGIRVIVAGLDKDYMGKAFGPMAELLAVAEYVTKLHAICVQCGNIASFSYRLIPSKDKVLLGAEAEYQARCRNCFNK